ncbi:inositol 2-dehydrogenase [Martelella sp. HB161492]|uniref:inositol 2-dehydrogenase n=1 Tax=Martelella sp. HB161492 TaxID=2720726 RepID=UPI0015904705|nr:inositol 2-dehydrogenase [Martelella sp. HB161492]
MTIGLALIGAGRIGKVHARAIAQTPGAKLVAVTDALAEAASGLAAQYDAAVKTIDAIEADADVAAVVICSPTDTHADLIERFARAGKAIFCEKPVDLSVARVRACLAVVRAEKAKLMLGFNRRFDPHFRAVKAAIDAGRIGTVEMVQITSRDPAPPPPAYAAVSGGIFRDMTIHDFDMARFLLGGEVETVQASAAAIVDPEIGRAGDFDSASIILTTADGRQCQISNSRRATYGYDQRIEVLGSKGAVSAENQRPVAIEIADAEGFHRPPLHDFFMTRYIEAYAAEISHFVAAIENGTAIAPDGEDGLKALIIAEAALLSVASGRRVALSEI